MPRTKGSLGFADGLKFFEPKQSRSEKVSNTSKVRGAKKLCNSYLPLTFRKTCPYKDIRDYVISKTSQDFPRCTTRWEIPRDCASVTLFNAKRVLREKILLITRMRHQQGTKRKFFDNKWTELSQHELAFKALFVKFNKFVKENQEKRERAEKKMIDEIELQKKRTIDIEILEETNARIAAVKILMEKKLKEIKIYEDFLNSAVSAGYGFKNINDLLARYESLIETRKILSEKQQETIRCLQNAQSNMAKLIEEKSLILVGLQNQLGNLQERYDVAYGKSLMWEFTVSKIHEAVVGEMTKMYMVKSSIDYMFMDMCKRQTAPVHIDENDYEAKLSFIKKTLMELTQASNKVRIMIGLDEKI